MEDQLHIDPPSESPAPVDNSALAFQFADRLRAWTASEGMGWEEVADIADGQIVNVRDRYGDYLATLTITRTAGH